MNGKEAKQRPHHETQKSIKTYWPCPAYSER
jgi:hypothetical protein